MQGGGPTPSNYQDEDVAAAWAEIFATDKYRVMISCISDNYPQKRSVNVDYADVNASSVDFAKLLLDEPDRCIAIAKRAVRSAIPDADRPGGDINVRVYNLPRDAKVEIRNLRSVHLRKLVSIDGLARKVTTVRPRITCALYRCARCGAEIWVDQPGMLIQEPLACNNPDGGCNKQSTRFILDDKESVYIDTQKVEIQESPEGLRGGAQPERITGYVEDDIAGLITAGNRVTFNGVLRSVEKGDRDKSTVFEIYLDVLSVEFQEHEYEEIVITKEDEEDIMEMSRDPELFDKIVGSISPSIYGLREVKQAIALQLFGGSPKTMDDGTVIRGDMHILLIGDPGVAKSQLLRYMSTLAPRGIYASGKSASAAGLTAAAVRDDFGDGRWTLEAGALVLADKGLACIDELDKMTDQDRSALHEAMESQRISVAKAGITATLQCRCSLLAAANPKWGRFDDQTTVADQIDLPPALMSRFDLIFVMTDKPDKDRDAQITEHILSTHQRGQVKMRQSPAKDVDTDAILRRTDNIRPAYDQEMIRKYVAYSKRIIPVMTDEAMSIIENAFLRIRRAGDGGAVPVTARQLEAFVRLSEASARMRLSDTVCDVDANRSVDLIENYLNRIAGSGDGVLDFDKVATGISAKDRDSIGVVRSIVRDAGDVGISKEEIIGKAQERGFAAKEVERTINSLYSKGELYGINGIYKVARCSSSCTRSGARGWSPPATRTWPAGPSRTASGG